MKIRDFLKNKKIKTSTDSDFKSVIEKICKDGGSGTYHLYRRADDSTRRYAMIADGEAKDIRDTDPEHWLRVSYGGGEYELRLDKSRDNGTEEIVKKFSFYVEGDPKESRIETQKKKETDTNNMLEAIKISFDLAEKLKGGNSEMALIMGVMQESSRQTTMMFTQMIEMQNKNHENMIRLMQENKSSENPVSEVLQNLMELKEFESSIVPKLEQDKTLEWFKALSSNPITAGLASKFMNFELPQGQQIPLIPASLPGSQGNGHKPTNLGSPSESVVTSQINPSINKDNQKAVPLYNLDEKPDDFETNMIDPLLDAISAGADAANIAIVINQIVQWSVTLSRIGKEVHPLMKGFVDFMVSLGESDIDFVLLDRVYTEFCSGIEMPAELVIPVKEELLKYYVPVFQQIMAARSKEKNKVIENEVTISESEDAAV